MDMADRKADVLRFRLRSAERFSEAAMRRGSLHVNTPSSSTSARLSRVTRADHLARGATRTWPFLGGAPDALVHDAAHAGGAAAPVEPGGRALRRCAQQSASSSDAADGSDGLL